MTHNHTNSLLSLLIILAVSVIAWQYVEAKEAQTLSALGAIAPQSQTTLPKEVLLEVPFIRQTPDGDWGPPWNNACEEAVIEMAELYYQGDTREAISGEETRRLLTPLFDIQKRLYGSSKDSDAERTSRTIEEYEGSFTTRIVINPSLEDLKSEIRSGRPVISLHYGIGLGNPEHHYVPTGSGYHMILLVGYDDQTREFITNDPEGPSGRNWRYSYDTIMSTLGDYNHQTYKVDGPPTVLFTQEK